MRYDPFGNGVRACCRSSLSDGESPAWSRGLLPLSSITLHPNPDFGTELSEFRTAMAGATGMPLVAGNRVEIYDNGDEFYPAMLDSIGLHLCQSPRNSTPGRRGNWMRSEAPIMIVP